MRWGSLWLTVLLVANNPANYQALDIIPNIEVPNVIPEKDSTLATNSISVATTNTERLTTTDENGIEATPGLTDPDDTEANTTEEDTEESTEEKIDDSSSENQPIEEIGDPPEVKTEEDEDDEELPPSDTSEAVSRPDGETRESSEPEDTNENNDTSKNSGNGDGNDDLVVITKSGSVQGFLWQDKEDIISYIDIPYGSINNHFQAATSKSWQDIHSVKDHNKRCPQLEDDKYVGHIDCLTLSIFKPLNTEDASVLFHIHADDLNTGSGDPSIYGPEHLVSNGIILVLPNYRLGPLGFLCMRNDTAPGNIALKDLSLALSWIYDNIKAFGGNPDNIAVSGEGKSGALAGLLALSPMSSNYLSKVIAESGSFLSYWALDRDPTSTADKLLDKIQNEEGQARTDISLSALSIEIVLTAAKGLEFRPCLENDDDNAFMSATPYETLTTEKFEKTTFMLGSAMYAGVHEALLQNEDSIKKLNEDFTVMLPDDLSFDTVALRNQVGEQVKKQYFGDEDINLEDLKSISLCFTDMGYLGPGIRSARLLAAAGATVYFYEFAYVGKLNRVLQSVNSSLEGAVRGDIIGYLFTQDGVMPGQELTEERKMVETLTTMWSNFLKIGEPSMENIEWNILKKDVEAAEEEWLLINAEPRLKKGIYVERLPLWTEIYQKHFIEGNDGHELSPSVYSVLIFQLLFWFSFCRNASHIY